MKKNIIITLLAAASLTSCGEYNKLLKSTDYEYKYEAAKNYFAKGQYNRSATLLNELITILKGTDKAEESLYMLGIIRQLPRRLSPISTLIPVVLSLNWHVSMQVNPCSWILRNHVWINQALIRLSSNCRCLWNISRTVPRSRKHKI